MAERGLPGGGQRHRLSVCGYRPYGGDERAVHVFWFFLQMNSGSDVAAKLRMLPAWLNVVGLFFQDKSWL
jgi:hypothetical protein